MANPPHVLPKRYEIKAVQHELLTSELKIYLANKHPKLIKDGNIVDFGYSKGVGLFPASNPAFIINNQELCEAYEQFRALPATEWKLNPKKITIQKEAELELKEFKAYLTTKHASLISADNITGFNYALMNKGRISTVLAMFTISNPEVFAAYEQFEKLPETAFRREPKVLKIKKEANLILAELRFVLNKTHRHLNNVDGSIAGLVHTPATLISKATFTINNPVLFAIAQKTIFKCQPKIITGEDIRKAIDTKEFIINHLFNGFKSYLTKNHADLIKGDDIVDTILTVKAVATDPLFTISSPEVYAAYKQFIKLPATVLKLKPEVITLKDVPVDLLLNELKAYLTKNHPDLIKDGDILDFMYMRASLPEVPSPYLTIGNKALLDAYQHFIKLPATVFKLHPKEISINTLLNRNVNAEFLLSEFKAYLTKTSSDLIKDGEIIDFAYIPAAGTGLLSFGAKFKISNPAVFDAYNKFKDLPHAAFVFQPKIIPIKGDVDLVLSEFKAYLTKNNADLIKKDQIKGLTHTKVAADNSAIITIASDYVFDAYQEFNKYKFNLKKNSVQEKFLGNINELKKQLDSIPDADPIRYKERAFLYTDLMRIEKNFFEKLTPELKPDELKNLINQFRNDCNAQANESDKVMGPGWLERCIEIIIKAVVGVYVAAGMVFITFFGQGFAREDHRKRFQDTFFKWEETEENKAIALFKQKTEANIVELEQDDTARATDAGSLRP